MDSKLRVDKLRKSKEEVASHYVRNEPGDSLIKSHTSLEVRQQYYDKCDRLRNDTLAADIVPMPSKSDRSVSSLFGPSDPKVNRGHQQQHQPLQQRQL